MAVLNKTRGKMLAKQLLMLNSNFHDTLRFLSQSGIPPDSALWITPCRGIYTIGHQQPVDIAFLDRDGHVVCMFRNFPPDCLADATRGAVSALELPANVLAESGTDVGDTLQLDPV